MATLMSIEEIAQEEGSGFCRGIGNGIKRGWFIDGEREQQIREICSKRPLFKLGTALGTAYSSLVYTLPIMLIAYNLYKYL